LPPMDKSTRTMSRKRGGGPPPEKGEAIWGGRNSFTDIASGVKKKKKKNQRKGTTRGKTTGNILSNVLVGNRRGE